MKTISILAIMAVCCFKAFSAYADETSNDAKTLEKRRYSKEAEATITSLPSMEKLWPDQAEEYFRSAKESVNTLSSISDSPRVDWALAELFRNVVQKNCPQDHGQAAVFFESERDFILYSLNSEKIRTNRASLIEFAGFLGQIRSREIPNYRNRGTNLPGREILQHAGVMDPKLLTNADSKREYEKAIEANKQDLIMNKLQSVLFESDRVVSFHLQNACSRFIAANPKDSEFINKIVSAAHLTKEEQNQLQP